MTALTEDGMIRDIGLLADTLENLEGNIWQPVVSQGGDPTRLELNEQAGKNRLVAKECLTRLGEVGGHFGTSLLGKAGITEREYKDAALTATAQLDRILISLGSDRLKAQELLLEQVPKLRAIQAALKNRKEAR